MKLYKKDGQAWENNRVVYMEVLWSMPPGDSMEKGKGYDDMIGCAVVVSVSTSYSRCYNLI